MVLEDKGWKYFLKAPPVIISEYLLSRTQRKQTSYFYLASTSLSIP